MKASLLLLTATLLLLPFSSALTMSNAATSAFSRHWALAEKACAYLTAATDPYHAVAAAVAKLEQAGFSKLSTKQPWNSQLSPGGKYYYTIQHSTLVAFTVGNKFSKDNVKKSAFHIIGGHTDSPNLRAKPRSKKPSTAGVVQLGVECYGGGLWHTWLDRDLSMSGKVIVRQGETLESRLVQLTDPVARVSSLCIHLQTADERTALKVNKEDHTSPIISSSVEKSLIEEITSQLATVGEDNNNNKTDPWQEGQEPLLLQRVAQQLDIDIKAIADWDLSLYDSQPAQLGGLSREFLYSGRLDNLATVFCAVEALTQYAGSDKIQDDPNICIVACFDHEEVGSQSSHGAGSPVLSDAMRRIGSTLWGSDWHDDTRAAVTANSFCLSIDQAHALHPNYINKHEKQHAPLLNKGVVVKTNSNQRYTTNSLTGFILRELARKADVPLQEFCVKNDCPCGSTIGPTIAAHTGLRVVDAGMPQLSMHSCREVMGVADLTHGYNLFTSFFEM